MAFPSVPGGAMGGHSFDIIIDYYQDEAAQKRVLAGASTIEDELKRLEQQADKTAKSLGRSYDATTKASAKASQAAKQTKEDYEKIYGAAEKAKTGVNDLGAAQKKSALEAAQAASAQAAIFSAQASALNAQQRQLQIQSREYKRLADGVSIVSRALVVLGTATVGGIFKAASDYVKDAPQATRETLRWKAAQDSINKSYERFGAVAVDVALPVLQKAARLAEQASDFAEKNPEVVRAALNTGLVLAGLGTIGLLVAKGIQLKSDILYIQSVPIQLKAAELQAAAAEQQLAAAELRAEGKGLDVVTDAETAAKGGGGLAGFGTGLARATVLLASFAGGLVVGDKIFDSIEKHDVTFNDYITELKQGFALTARNVGNLIGQTGIMRNGQLSYDPALGDKWFVKLRDGILHLKDTADKTGDSLEKIPALGTVEASPNMEKILSAYEKYKAEDLQLVQDHYAKRSAIVKGALADELAANQKFAQEVTAVQNKEASDIAKAQADFDRQASEDAQKHALERAKILRDGGEEIQKIEKDLQETLRKNELEHKDKVQALLGQRDAVGLVLENKRYLQQQAEATRGANAEIRQRRADLAQRLQDFDIEYQQERERRLADFQARIAEIQQNAADRLAELNREHEAEIQKIREQAVAKLQEEDKNFAAERKRRYDYFVQQVKDLDQFLLASKQITDGARKQELADLNTWAANYRAGLNSALPGAVQVPGASTGGYVTGIVQTGEEGYEWVATHASTHAAEQILGTRLTQENFLSALKMSRSSGQMNNNTYVDQKRLEFPIGKEAKQMYTDIATEVFSKMMAGRG